VKQTVDNPNVLVHECGWNYVLVFTN
jgi:hypothetical protein